MAGRCISKTDTLYLSTPTRAVGLLLGSAFAMVWRPAAVMRGPMRERGPFLDGVAVVGLIALGALCWLLHIVTPEGADPWLFRGGFLLTGFATLAVIAAVTHRRAAMGTLLGNPVFVWVGTRSYGLYLYHWPIFQGIRRVAGNVLSLPEFIVAMIASGIVAELSYRYIETPVRKGALGRAWTRLRHGGSSDTTRRTIAVGAAALVVVVGVAGASLATAENKPNDIERSGKEGAQFTGDPFATTTTIAGATTTAAPSTVDAADRRPRPRRRRSAACRRRCRGTRRSARHRPPHRPPSPRRRAGTGDRVRPERQPVRADPDPEARHRRLGHGRSGRAAQRGRVLRRCQAVPSVHRRHRRHPEAARRSASSARSSSSPSAPTAPSATAS